MNISRRLLLAAGLSAAVLLTRGFADDAKEAPEFKATCPVSGQPAIEDSSREYKGKTVYFCCQNCPKAYEADPDKFATKANHQLFETGQILQVACPFTGAAVNPDTAVDVAGVKVAFCCDKCKAKYEAAATDEQVTLVFGDISKGFTLQTLCPVSGEAIDPKFSVEHEGKKVYFCCDKCPAAFEKDPAKFLDKLPQFAEEKKAE